MLPRTSGTPIADQSLFSGDAIHTNLTMQGQRASTLVSELLPALDAYTFAIRPGSCAVTWTDFDEQTLHIAHDPEWFTADQAVAVVRLALGRRITLVQAVTL